MRAKTTRSTARQSPDKLTAKNRKGQAVKMPRDSEMRLTGNAIIGELQLLGSQATMNQHSGNPATDMAARKIAVLAKSLMDNHIKMMKTLVAPAGFRSELDTLIPAIREFAKAISKMQFAHPHNQDRAQGTALSMARRAEWIVPASKRLISEYDNIVSPGVLSSGPLKWGDPTVSTMLGSQLASILTGSRSATWHSKLGQTFTFRRLDNGSVGLWMGTGAPPMPPLQRFATVQGAQHWLDERTKTKTKPAT